MIQANDWRLQLWLCVIVCFFDLYLQVVESRRFDKCLTRDQRQGVCVVRKYCREASVSSSRVSSCGNSEVCCPVPTKAVDTDAMDTEERSSTEGPRRDNMRKDETPAITRWTEPTPPSRREHVFEDDRSQRPSSSRGQDSDRWENVDIEKDRRLHPTSRTETVEKVLPHRPTQPSPTRGSTRYTESFSESRPRPPEPACGVKPYDLFIAGGEVADEHEWPWMAAIFRRHQGSRENTYLCGGSLINNRYVLSAAHCFVHNYVVLPASSFVVTLGSHYLGTGEDYTVAKLIVHQNHSGSNYFNDIALIRLASVVYFTDKIAPACLPTVNMQTKNFIDELATVTGWGDVSFRTSRSRALQQVSVPVVSNDECSAAYSRVSGAAFLARGSDNILCAGLREGGKDACLVRNFDQISDITAETATSFGNE